MSNARSVNVGDMVTWGLCLEDEEVVAILSDGLMVTYYGDKTRPYYVTWGGNGAGAIVHADRAEILRAS